MGEEYYLLASALASRRRKLLLCHDEAFTIFDPSGEIPVTGLEALGLFYRDTRFLSLLEIRLNGEIPHLLVSMHTPDAISLETQMTNADVRRNDLIVVPRDTIAVRRLKTLCADTLYETLRLQNFHVEALEVEIEFHFDADFVDLFELRGLVRPRRGRMLEPRVGEASVTLGYEGLDGIVRETEIQFTPAPVRIGPGTAAFRIGLESREIAPLELRITCHAGGPPPSDASSPSSHVMALRRLRRERRQRHESAARLESANELFTEWAHRSMEDVNLLRANTPHGPYVLAGIPWYATIFGRDGLITAFEMLAFAPEIAAQVLRVLAKLQGTKDDPQRDEEPGKMPHELRAGEMAILGEIPFARYYGSVDATPLWVVLLDAYVARTGDLALARMLWPCALNAMAWIEQRGVREEGGYLVYERRGKRGLENQGWKDSFDAIMHRDGSLAAPPIALVEAQGYFHAALRAMARLCRILEGAGGEEQAAAWEARARALRARFHADFWRPETGTLALALDGGGRPCEVVASNAGHALWSGIVEQGVAAKVIPRLMREDLFCGWGLRTLSAEEARFNPMSYHNGSVWPHDSAIAAAGFRRYGYSKEAVRLFTAAFDASLAVEDRRVPELFCGFARREGARPIPYPVACSPQAWASASPFLLVQASLGLTFDPARNRILFDRPQVPPWLDWLKVLNLRLGGSRVDLMFRRVQTHASVEILDQEGSAQVIVRK